MKVTCGIRPVYVCWNSPNADERCFEAPALETDVKCCQIGAADRDERHIEKSRREGATDLIEVPSALRQTLISIRSFGGALQASRTGSCGRW